MKTELRESHVGREANLRTVLRLCIVLLHARAAVTKYTVAESFGVTDRTAHRWLLFLEEEGFAEHSDKPCTRAGPWRWYATQQLKELLNAGETARWQAN